MLNDTKAAAGRKICGCFLCISHRFFCCAAVGGISHGFFLLRGGGGISHRFHRFHRFFCGGIFVLAVVEFHTDFTDFCGRRVGYVVAVEADFRVLQTHRGVARYRGFRFATPRLRATRSARAFDLSGRAAVKQVMISLSEVVLLGMMTIPHRSLRSLCLVLTKNQPLGGRAAVLYHSNNSCFG